MSERMTATYSPEDNKLRLYSSERLSPEVYGQVRGAGFIWAPMQKLFVAPAWTPEREDLLLELCGEIEDDAKSLTERAQERAERFKEYSANRKEDAENARETVSAIADNIPLGQPILVGHHSEARARKDAERIENGMRRAVQLWETSKYWEDRAKGALRNAKYKEHPQVRARRIKGLESDKRKQERAKAEAQFFLAAWSDDKEELTLAKAKALANHGSLGGVVLHDGSKCWSGWSALEDNKLTPLEVKDQLIPQFQETISRAQRWLNHYANRITYEKLLLEESGGIATDRVKPETGGAVKCWASRGAWSYIQKVNKVSVSILRSWQEDSDSGNFTQTIPFDQLSKLMSKAEVEAKRASGELFERQNKTGFMLSTSTETEKPRSTETPQKKDSARSAFEAMEDQLKEGVKVVSAPSLFPTPQAIAAQMRDLARIDLKCKRILEPSAGTGNILREIVNWAPSQGVEAVEINSALAQNLKERFKDVTVHCADFLQFSDNKGFDRIIMNPPFENGDDIKHIMHALDLLKPTGRLVAICANGPRQNDKLKPLAETWQELPADTFKDSGTHVSAVLFTIQK